MNGAINDSLTRLADTDRWIEVDLDSVIHNIKTVKRAMKNGCKLMVVVKADAYGLGAPEIAGTIDDMDEVFMFGVSTVEEGIRLRNNNIQKPILVFAPVNSATSLLIRKNGLVATVDSISSIQALSNAGSTPHPCHLKINTGMNRFGVLPGRAWEMLKIIDNNPNLNLQGIYTSLSKSSSGKGTALRQIRAFDNFVRETDKLGIERGMAHVVDSPAFIRFPAYHMDMVRLGSLIMGQENKRIKTDLDLKKPYRVLSRVIALNELQKGDPVGYGPDYITTKKQRIAIIGIGYSDGFTMEAQDRDLGITGAFVQLFNSLLRIAANSPLHFAEWNGNKLTLIGRVGMKFSAIRIYKHPLKVGDVVSLSVNMITSNAYLRRYYFLRDSLICIRDFNDNKTDLS